MSDEGMYFYSLCYCRAEPTMMPDVIHVFVINPQIWWWLYFCWLASDIAITTSPTVLTETAPRKQAHYHD